MEKQLNYLLGFGERLTESIRQPPRRMDKAHPYSFSEAKERVAQQVITTVDAINHLPDAACPNGEAVALITIHPAYLAKSYYPTDLFNAAGVTAIGSRQREISPDKWATKKSPESAITAEFFVAGKRSRFNQLADSISNWSEESLGAEDLRKVEYFSPPEGRVKEMRSDTDYPLLEVVLHASAATYSNYILEGFKKYLNDLDIIVDLDRRLHSGGLCFLPVKVPKTALNQIAKFSFLRVAREMPSLRPFRPALVRHVKSSTNFECELPTEEALDPHIKVAVFDGGMPNISKLDKWVKHKEVGKLGDPVPGYLDHGLSVTSALLFGSLEYGSNPVTPFAPIDHYRVLDAETNADAQDQLLDVLQRIRNVLQDQTYDYVNLSIGPDLPIEDDDVHAWTAVLDPLLADGKTLTSIAVGNSGENDWGSGNARVQVPADCVNALSVGACDRLDSKWKRASYSSIGPGRSPGIVKPDALAFGGSDSNPFFVLEAGETNGFLPTMGTSFAAPLALRTAIGIRAILGDSMSPLATKALLLHRCENEGHEPQEAGRGRILNSLQSLIVCEDATVHIVYQGELAPAQWIRAQIPMPAGTLDGNVEIAATVCFTTEIDPQDTINYTRSGLDIHFRPHSGKIKPKSTYATTKSFFQSTNRYAKEVDVRKDAYKWETTMSASTKMKGLSLQDPVLDIHYNARTAGGPAQDPKNIPYALVITVKAPKAPDIYNKIVQRYRTVLEVLTPAVEIPILT